LFFLLKAVGPLVDEVWKQTSIRDRIEKKTKIKLELENLLNVKKLGKDIEKFNLSKELQEKIKKETQKNLSIKKKIK